EAALARGGVALGLILVVLLLPQGVMPSLIRWWRALAPRSLVPSLALPEPLVPAPRSDEAAGGGEIPVLDCRDVWKTFGGVQALKGVTLDVRQGEILGLVGPNGSGKSTLINVITGHFRIDRGSIAFAGRQIGEMPAHRVARLGVARTYQIPRPFNHLTVLDNVALAASFGDGHGETDARRMAAHWLGYTGLARKAFEYPPQLNLH